MIMIDENKISKVLELQDLANQQIEVNGQALEHTADELMQLIDSLTAEEEDFLLEKYFSEIFR
jgi:hypothetical protein